MSQNRVGGFVFNTLSGQLMKAWALSFALLMLASLIAGCTSDMLEGESAFVDDVYVYVDGTFAADDTICNTAVVIESGEYYTCSFTLNERAKIAIELDVSTNGSNIDLITMDDLNFEEWKEGDAYYYKKDLSEFDTYGGTYDPDGTLDKGDYVVVVSNRD